MNGELTDPAARREELAKALASKQGDRVAALESKLTRLQGSVLKTLILRSQADPRTTHVHIRGDFLNPGDEVRPGTLASLPSVETSGDRATRLDLAQWLVRDDQPLTPRVVVNRIWQRCFGHGLVETENDFGVQGSRPTT